LRDGWCWKRVATNADLVYRDRDTPADRDAGDRYRVAHYHSQHATVQPNGWRLLHG